MGASKIFREKFPKGSYIESMILAGNKKGKEIAYSSSSQSQSSSQQQSSSSSSKIIRQTYSEINFEFNSHFYTGPNNARNDRAWCRSLIGSDRENQPRNYLLNFICSDDKIFSRRPPFPLWGPNFGRFPTNSE